MNSKQNFLSYFRKNAACINVSLYFLSSIFYMYVWLGRLIFQALIKYLILGNGIREQSSILTLVSYVYFELSVCRGDFVNYRYNNS